MLIRNALIDGRITDLRLMHGRVREMGVDLVKGLYESEIDLSGDELRPIAADTPLPPRIARRLRELPAPGAHIVPGTPAPLTRWRNGAMLALMDEHAAD